MLRLLDMDTREEQGSGEDGGTSNAAQSSGLAAWAAAPKLSVRQVGDRTLVYVDAMLITQFPSGDVGARNTTVAGLAEGGTFSVTQIADAFGISKGRVSQLRRKFREQGAAGLARRGGAPRGPRKLTQKEVERARSLRRDGLTIDQICSAINGRSGKRVGRTTVFRAIRDVEPRATLTLPLLLTGEHSEESSEPSTEGARCDGGDRDVTCAAIANGDDARPTRPQDLALVNAYEPTALGIADVSLCEPNGDLEAARVDDQFVDDQPRECSTAGAMVAHVAFEALGLRKALADSGARLRAALTFDLLRVASVLLCGILLRYRSVESLRMLIRSDFGALLGVDRAPEIRTVRRKLQELSEPSTGFSGARFVRSLASSLLDDAAAPEGVFFFDDHFARYHGKRPFGKGRDAKSRLCVPGREDVYVHDLRSRAVLFVPLPAPTSLSLAMPRALAELKEIGVTPQLVVFDRGGWSKDLFRSLLDQNEGSPRIDVLTYLNARKKPRELPANRFRTEEIEVGGKVYRYDLAEHRRRSRVAGVKTLLRVIVLRDDKNRQIPIVTSASSEFLPAARAVYVLRARWRQENSFKYLVGEFDIDALIAREVDLSPSDRVVKNPERQEIKAELAEAQQELARCEQALGSALADNQESCRPTVRGLKIANADLLQTRREAVERVTTLEEDLAGTPAKIPLTTLDPEAKRATERTERRLFVNGLKLLVHNAERWLVDRMGSGPYEHHGFPILRALANQPGRIWRERGQLIVEIQPLDTPRYQRVVEQLLPVLNERGARFLDTDLRLVFRVGTTAREAGCHVL